MLQRSDPMTTATATADQGDLARKQMSVPSDADLGNAPGSMLSFSFSLWEDHKM
jgi:hypothetical protein